MNDSKNLKGSYSKQLIFLTIVSIVFFIPKTISLKPIIPFGSFIITFLLFILFVYMILKRPYIHFSNDYRLVTLFIFTFFLYCILSAFWSDLQFESMWRAIIVFVPIFLYSLLIQYDENIFNTNIRIYFVLSWLGLLLSIIGISVYFLGSISKVNDSMVNSFGFIDQIVHIQGDIVRISSVTGNPNSLGLVLMVSIPITLGLLLMDKIKMRFFLISIIIQLIALVMTYSRTNIIVTLFIITIFSILFKREGNKRSGIQTFIKLIVFFGVVTAPIFFINSKYSLKGLDLSDRQIAWEMLISEFKNHPFTGMGFNVSVEFLERTWFDILNAHNLYIGILAELGILGLIIMLISLSSVIILVIRVLYPFNRKYLQKPQYKMLLLNICLIIGIYINQFTEIILFRAPDFLNLLWVYLVFSSLKLKEQLLQDKK